MFKYFYFKGFLFNDQPESKFERINLNNYRDKPSSPLNKIAIINSRNVQDLGFYVILNKFISRNKTTI